MADKMKIQSPKGMHDILPTAQNAWFRLRQIVEDFAKFYHYGYIETPVVENADLFTLAVGATSDIVEKQMFYIKSKGKDELVLRPEGTAPIARAYLNHGLITWLQPIKLFYGGPFFRYEQPQEGRYRALHQYGFEILGEEDAAADAEVIMTIWKILEKIGLRSLKLQVNTIGCRDCRGQLREALRGYYRNKITKLCSDCRRRFKKNPFRLLDCKNEICQPFKTETPNLLDLLCKDCHRHFKNLLEFFDDLEIPYFLNQYLVRGIDYYTRTVFEITPEDRPDYALASGGRYDDLIKLLSSKNVPGMGGALGIERVLGELPKEKTQKSFEELFKADLFLVHLGYLAKRKSLAMLENFHKAGVNIYASPGKDNIKSQLRLADKLQVRLSLILGQKEVIENQIIIRDMKTGIQETVRLERVVEEVRKRLK